MNQPARSTDELGLYITTHIKFLDWAFVIRDDDGGRPYLQIQFMAPDADDPDSRPIVQKCRKWFLSPYMTDTELVRTAHKAVRAAIEHECDENFKFDGLPIFSPHTDVLSLWNARILGGDDVRK